MDHLPSGLFLTPRDCVLEAWAFSQGVGCKTGACHQGSCLTDTLQHHPHVHSIFRPISPDPAQATPAFSERREEEVECCSFPRRLVPSPLAFEPRRHSDSSMGLVSEMEGEQMVAYEARARRSSLSHAPLCPHPLCHACPSLRLLRTRTEKSAALPPPCMCASQRLSPVPSPTGLLPCTGVHKGSHIESADLSDLNKSLQSITGHKHTPNPPFLRVPPVVAETGPYRPARSHGDEKQMVEFLSATAQPVTS
ncbi:uncharacterized protein [Salminus brasiliensis]|uniref:uncharacterized protein n=1 Tax=Salminus brasiliensis TaxID=930266 RepID=UPI003B835DFA